MKANERRADEIVTACSRASYDGIDPRSVILIAIDAAERRGEERVLRWMDRVRASAWIGGAHRPVVSEYRKARRARVGRGRK